MTDQDRNKAWGFSLFGDDLRAEVGGKLSLMGLYQSDMFFPKSTVFPVNLPKFCILIMYFEKMGTLESDVTFKITQGPDRTPVAEFALARKDLPNSSTAVEPVEGDRSEELERIFHARLPVTLSPFPVLGNGRLSVRAHYSDGFILKLGSLSVKTVSDDEYNRMIGLVPPPEPS